MHEVFYYQIQIDLMPKNKISVNDCCCFKSADVYEDKK